MLWNLKTAMIKILCAASLSLVTALAQAAVPDCEEGAKPNLGQISERVILVGEIHGTEQAPAFVARLVCGLLAQNRHVILALERDESEHAATERFLASGGSPADITALLSQPEWNNPLQDGRSSQAVFGLLDRLRKWRQIGLRVEVLMMRKRLPPMDLKALQAKLDLDMADSVTAALDLHHAHVAVVYAGAFHLTVGSKMHQDIVGAPSTGDILMARMPVHVLGLSSAGGETWGCFQANSCGPKVEHAGSFDSPDARADTRIDLGPLTASSPAARSKAETR